MSQAARNRASRRRKQPYAWLGVGAVTLGMGAAMVGGTAVAFAGTGDATGDSTGTSSASEKPGNDAGPTASDAPSTKPATRGGGVVGARGAGDSTSTPGHRGRSAVVVADVTPEVTLPELPTPTVSQETVAKPEVTPADNSPLPAAAVAPTRVHDSAVAVKAPAKPEAVAPVVDTTPALPDVSAAASTIAVTPTPAASTPAPAAASDPAPNMKSWLPVTPIIPGARVTVAMEQIKQAQTLLTQETWGSGNVLAGIGSLGPASALAVAQLALSIWGSTIAGAQDFSRNTADNPWIHWIAQAALQVELVIPKVSDAALATANILMTPLNWVGADVSGAQALTAQARENGKIYAQVPIRMVAGTQPVVGVKVAGGSKATLLVDTGASGLVTTRDKVNAANLGPITGSGNSCFSGSLCYHYETYNATVDLGDGAVGVAPVNIVTNNVQYPNSEAAFKQFFSWGADGILGVGANTEGPGPKPIPTAAMPGELSDGLLIYQNAYPFGLGGYMILGPNLFPTRVSLPGAPDAFVDVSLNGATPPKTSGAIIDSGGVFGTILRKDIPVGVTPEKIGGVDYLPAGVKISVYAPGTTTLLYTYTTISGGTPVIDSGLFNTGNAPYAQNPIYLNYATVPYTGIGSTDFSIA